MDSWRTRGSSPWGIHPLPFSYIVHFLAIVSVAFVLIWTIYFRGGIDFNASDSNLIFNVHPFMMLFSFVFLASEAIMVYKTAPASKPVKKLIHLSLHLVAFALAVFGICAAFKYHNLNSIDNLYSLHSWLGLTTTILFGLQWLIGFVSFFFPGLAPNVRASVLPWHVFFGLFVYGLAIATAELGFLEKLTFLQSGGTITKFGSEAMFVNTLGLLVVLSGIFVLITAVLPDVPTGDGYSPIE